MDPQTRLLSVLEFLEKCPRDQQDNPTPESQKAVQAIMAGHFDEETPRA